MKTIIYFLISTVFIFGFSNCSKQVQQRTTTTVTNEKVTYSDQGFMVEQQTIIRGNTVWGISERVYGTGMRWRDILALNPFLNTPDRLYYNTDRKMWIVRIYPGEVLNIGGQKVYPSCTYESTTTVTTTEPTDDNSIMPWWGWVIIALSGILILGAIICYLCKNCCFFQREPYCDINTRTRRSFIEEHRMYKNRIVDRMFDHGNLKSFDLDENTNFKLSAEYYEGKKEN